jgi:hypothetical protein
MNDYQFKDSHSIITPALIFYYDGIKENISKTVRIAGDSKKLWPQLLAIYDFDFPLCKKHSVK